MFGRAVLGFFEKRDYLIARDNQKPFEEVNPLLLYYTCWLGAMNTRQVQASAADHDSSGRKKASRLGRFDRACDPQLPDRRKK